MGLQPPPRNHLPRPQQRVLLPQVVVSLVAEEKEEVMVLLVIAAPHPMIAKKPAEVVSVASKLSSMQLFLFDIH